MDMMAAGLECKVVPICDEARVSFYIAFGIMPYQQMALEKLLREKAGYLTAGPILNPGESFGTTHILDIADGWN